MTNRLITEEKDRLNGVFRSRSVGQKTQTLIDNADEIAGRKKQHNRETLFLNALGGELDLMRVNIALLDAAREGLMPSVLLREMQT